MLFNKEAPQTHQEYPLQLILDVLHPGEGSHSLDHLNENAAHSPRSGKKAHDKTSLRTQTSENYATCIKLQLGVSQSKQQKQRM